MIYMLFIDADSDSIEKIAELIHHRLMGYPDVGWGTITDGNHTLMVVHRHGGICEENKNPRTYAIITFGINKYNDENRSNYNQRGVMSIETDDIVKYTDIIGIINDIIQTECKIEKLHPMAYMDIDYEPEKLIDETIKSVYLKFTCHREEGKPSE
jgi:hypothetical protein